jgi:hypothetical protein
VGEADVELPELTVRQAQGGRHSEVLVDHGVHLAVEPPERLEEQWHVRLAERRLAHDAELDRLGHRDVLFADPLTDDRVHRCGVDVVIRSMIAVLSPSQRETCRCRMRGQCPTKEPLDPPLPGGGLAGDPMLDSRQGRYVSLR